MVAEPSVLLIFSNKRDVGMESCQDRPRTAKPTARLDRACQVRLALCLLLSLRPDPQGGLCPQCPWSAGLTGPWGELSCPPR